MIRSPFVYLLRPQRLKIVLKTALWVCLLSLFALALASKAYSQASKPTQLFVFDVTTNTLLIEKNPDMRMPTSSMSKALTLYVLFEDLRDGRVHLDDKALISRKAFNMRGSRMFLEYGTRVRIEDLIRGVAVQSGNDAAVAIAEFVEGDEASFASRMNETAARLGMASSHFMNASGWPDPNHYSTVRDLAKLTIALKRDFPEYFRYFSEPSFKYNNIKQPNRNPLLKHFDGADGLKTGHTEDAGYGLIGTATRRGREIVLVMNGAESKKDRRLKSLNFMEQAFTKYRITTAAVGGQPLTDVEVWFGQQKFVPLAPVNDIKLSIQERERKKLTAKARVREPLLAPIRQGDQLGELVIMAEERVLTRAPLVATQDIDTSGFIDRASFTAYRLIADLFNSQ